MIEKFTKKITVPPTEPSEYEVDSFMCSICAQSFDTYEYAQNHHGSQHSILDWTLGDGEKTPEFVKLGSEEDAKAYSHYRLDYHTIEDLAWSGPGWYRCYTRFDTRDDEFLTIEPIQNTIESKLYKVKKLQAEIKELEAIKKR